MRCVLLRRILTMVFVAAFALALSLEGAALGAVGDGGSQKNPVTVEVDQSEVGTIYSVDMVWDSLNFVYDLGAGTWDPLSHTVSGGSAAWQDTSANIVVTNHSNAAVSISAAFSGASQSATKNDVTATLTNHDFDLAAGQLNKPQEAAQNTIQVDVSGTPSVGGRFEVDTVTVAVSRVS